VRRADAASSWRTALNAVAMTSLLAHVDIQLEKKPFSSRADAIT
jgi:hypothetical protein